VSGKDALIKNEIGSDSDEVFTHSGAVAVHLDDPVQRRVQHPGLEQNRKEFCYDGV